MNFIKKHKQRFGFGLLLLVAVLLPYFALKKEAPQLTNVLVINPITIDAKIIQNITYKTVDTSKIKLDLYLPKLSKPSKTPLLIYIHGGGWATGDKQSIRNDFRPYLLTALLKKGYAVASINYRLTNQKNIHFPAPIDDCKDAIRWLHKNAEVYNLDNNNFGLWGTSAGAHLALLAGYTGSDTFTENTNLKPFSSQVNYVIDCFGPTDLNELFKPEYSDFSLQFLKLYSKKMYYKRQSRLETFTGLDISKEKEKVAQCCQLYSPIQYINTNTIPTLIFHGSTDETVSLKQSELLDKALTTNKIPHEFKIFKDQNHGLISLTKTETDELVNTAITFIENNSKK